MWQHDSESPQQVLVGSIQKFSVEDGPGIRTTIFLKGCPLACKWCHNPELINSSQQLIQSRTNCIGCGCCVEACPQGALSMDADDKIQVDWGKCDGCLECTHYCYARALRPVAQLMTAEEILDIAGQDKAFYDNTAGGITLSGGEVLLHARFVSDLIDKAKKRGISVCLDTCGFGSASALRELAEKSNVTTILYDLKTLDGPTHKKYTGVDNDVIIKNLRLLAQDEEIRSKLIIRVPLIAGVNDSEKDIHAFGDFLSELGIQMLDLLVYHRLGIQKQRNIGGVQEEFLAPDEEHLEAIRQYFAHDLHMQVGILGQV